MEKGEAGYIGIVRNIVRPFPTSTYAGKRELGPCFQVRDDKKTVKLLTVDFRILFSFCKIFTKYQSHKYALISVEYFRVILMHFS